MTLTEYLEGMQVASTAGELEAAIQAPHKHRYIGPTWTRICKARIAAGVRICGTHKYGCYVPRFDSKSRRLTICDENYYVGRGQNTTGVRYCWHAAQQWAEGVLRDKGFSRRAAHAVWSWAFDYPHRALQNVETALAGGLPDPVFNRLILSSLSGPVRVNRREESKHRAWRPCRCGGRRWDWGCGWNGYVNFINWYCDRCSRVYIEYVDNERLAEIRAAPSRRAA